MTAVLHYFFLFSRIQLKGLFVFCFSEHFLIVVNLTLVVKNCWNDRLFNDICINCSEFEQDKIWQAKIFYYKSKKAAWRSAAPDMVIFNLKRNVYVHVISLGDFLCIPTPNTGQLNPLFHTFAEFRLIVNRIVVRQSTDWLAANAQFSPRCTWSNFVVHTRSF